MTPNTKVFGQFYKVFNPENIPDANWHTASFSALSASGQCNSGQPYSASYGRLLDAYISSSRQNLMFSSSFFNFPTAPSPSSSYIDTRWISSSLAFKDQADNFVSMSAVPWGSMAGDMLWNILTPSWSIDRTVGFSSGSLVGDLLTYTPTWQSKSFFSEHEANGSIFGIGTASAYSVTSSWKVFDPKYLRFQHLDSYPANLIGPTPFALRAGCYQVHVDPTTGLVATDAGLDPLIDIDCFNAVNDTPFDMAGGAAITQVEVSSSLAAQIAAGSTAQFDRALRSRRLYFPIAVEGAGTIVGGDYWLKATTGLNVSEMFTETGGIYNLKFKLKRWNTDWIAGDYGSPSGSNTNLIFDPNLTDGTAIENRGAWDMSTAYPADNSFMNVFIHDVQSTTPATLGRVPGAPGWYPLANNIVTIGNGYGPTPILTFQDTQTGYREEQFDIVLVQYGWPAQLCFEPSGSADSPWGCVIGDIQICKLGVTDDPRFTKRVTLSGRVRAAKIGPSLGFTTG